MFFNYQRVTLSTTLRYSQFPHKYRTTRNAWLIWENENALYSTDTSKRVCVKTKIPSCYLEWKVPRNNRVCVYPWLCDFPFAGVEFNLFWSLKGAIVGFSMNLQIRYTWIPSFIVRRVKRHCWWSCLNCTNKLPPGFDFIRALTPVSKAVFLGCKQRGFLTALP